MTQAELLELAAGCHSGGQRCLLGLVGPPGSGKSTLAAYLAESLRPSPPVVPLDGFHLAQAVIDAEGLSGRKGAPETFDGWGFASLIARMTNPAGDTIVYAPTFDRSIEEPVAGAIPVGPGDSLVIVEGNYLLLEEPPWDRIRPALDLCVYLELDDGTRVRRLVERHVRYGKTPTEAERFARNSDERNAHLIKSTCDRADFIVRMDSTAPP
ncbi:MAG: nucleoside/nucleotide kinase family protein [Acidimicrobiaceae bacterium]|nr:nucleoside/nucleotide kinase family protein [Acidimicrobiaceae bacterium]MDE0515844.1 nucleoside/nucleotide kinase family protein [Acidimicrobiaceae bacterium]